MDENGDIIDFLKGREDLDKKIIRTVGDAKERFEEDALRILRAIRFATSLDFSLDLEVVESIQENRELLKNISYNKKRLELDKIFTSSNASKGIGLLINYKLDKSLELDNLDKITNTDSLIGIWSILNVSDIKIDYDNLFRNNIRYIQKSFITDFISIIYE
jgi:tRNA nucleotidyltransferase/poly(A) polymerase